MADGPAGRNPSRREFLGVAAALAVSPAVLAKQGLGLALPAVELSLPPLLARPTASSVLINTRNGGESVSAVVELLGAEGPDIMRTTPPILAAPGAMLEWNLTGLTPATRYRYRIRAAGSTGADGLLGRGGFITARGASDQFTMVLMTDPHTGSWADGSANLRVMDDVIANVERDAPDFILALGDNVAWSSSRNAAQTSDAGAVAAYEQYRRHMGRLTAYAPHFSALGNWDGESGKFPAASVALVRGVRHRLLPNPDHRTYAEGGSAAQDYYAFTWGPALWVVLNVQSYSKSSVPIPLPSARDVERVEDWTLGPEQLAWLERTLKGSSAPFKFIGIHHTVGGNAGNPSDTLYGRGGARAANVGEQKIVHQLMRDHGVQIFFYAHDHVFVDDVVDGIHYALPGSFGAPWHFQPGVTGYDKFWPDSGHARVTVSPKETVVEYVNQTGSVFHSFTVLPK
jgi:hypothetical protein